MLMTRRFVWAEHEDTGISGWSALFIPKSADFTPNSGRGLMHDMLEHSMSDKGTFAEEVMAYGRLIALRVLPGVFSPSARRGYGLGSELYGAWVDADMPTVEAPPVGKLNDPDAMGEIRRVVREFSSMGLTEQDACLHSKQAERDALYRLLLIGYRSAVWYYEGLGKGNLSSIGWAADECARKLGRVVGEDGDRLDITLDTRNADFTWRVRTTDETVRGRDRELGYYPGWLRKWLRS